MCAVWLAGSRECLLNLPLKSVTEGFFFFFVIQQDFDLLLDKAFLGQNNKKGKLE